MEIYQRVVGIFISKNKAKSALDYLFWIITDINIDCKGMAVLIKVSHGISTPSGRLYITRAFF